jgi:hypothetical protein
MADTIYLDHTIVKIYLDFWILIAAGIVGVASYATPGLLAGS